MSCWWSTISQISNPTSMTNNFRLAKRKVGSNTGTGTAAPGILWPVKVADIAGSGQFWRIFWGGFFFCGKNIWISTSFVEIKIGDLGEKNKMEFSQTWWFRKTCDDFPGQMESYFTNLDFPDFEGSVPIPLLFTTHLGNMLVV